MGIAKQISGTFENMTWGHLRYLVAQADEAGVEDDAEVEFLWDDEDEANDERLGISLTLRESE